MINLKKNYWLNLCLCSWNYTFLEPKIFISSYLLFKKNCPESHGEWDHLCRITFLCAYTCIKKLWKKSHTCKQIKPYSLKNSVYWTLWKLFLGLKSYNKFNFVLNISQVLKLPNIMISTAADPFPSLLVSEVLSQYMY